MVIQISRTPSSSKINDISTTNSSLQLVKPVASAPSIREYDSDVLFTDSVTYYRIYYRSNRTASKSFHLKQNTYHFSALNRTYGASVMIKDDHRRCTQ